MTRRNHKKESDVQDVNHFMHEVEEAMHIDAMLDFWHTYKVAIISTLVGAFLLVTGWQWFLMTKEEGLNAQANTLYQAQSTANEADFQRLMVEGSGGFKLLANLQTAKMHAEKGETEQAVAIYDNLMAEADEAEFKQLVQFYKAMTLMATKAEESENLYKNLVEVNGPFVMPAQEMLGVLAESKGNAEQAKKYYEMIKTNPITPKTMRERVMSRLESLNRLQS